jgi:hypothetical protein
MLADQQSTQVKEPPPLLNMAEILPRLGGGVKSYFVKFYSSSTVINVTTSIGWASNQVSDNASKFARIQRWQRPPAARGNPLVQVTPLPCRLHPSVCFGGFAGSARAPAPGGRLVLARMNRARRGASPTIPGRPGEGSIVSPSPAPAAGGGVAASRRCARRNRFPTC